MKHLWKKVLVFVMVIGTITTSLAQTDTRATLFVAGFVETIARIFIIPRQDAASNIDMTGVTTTVVADFYIETNTDQVFTVSGWSVNGGQLCDGTQGVAAITYDPTLAAGLNCLGYDITWTTGSAVGAPGPVEPGAAGVTLAQGLGGATLLSTYTPVAGVAAGIITGAIQVNPDAPVGTLPAGRYDDTIVFQLQTP